MDPPFVKGKIAPFYQLDEYAFQSLCCDILGAEPKVATCAVYGKRGQAQFGVDLLAHRDGHDGIDVAQCKCYEQFSPGLVAAASDDFLNHWKEHWEERGVRRFILITACDIEDRKTVDAITEQKPRFTEHGLEYHCWPARIIQAKLRPHRPIAASHILEAWVQLICGSPDFKGEALQPPEPQTASIISSALVTQLQNLSEIVSAEVREGLERSRADWRNGEQRQAYEWVSGLRSDRIRWDALSPLVQAGVLRFEARLVLELERDTDAASRLAEEADALAGDNDVKLNALIIAHKEGPTAALKLLANVGEQNVTNLKAALLLEQGLARNALEVLSNDIDDADTNAETHRLRALAHIINGESAQAQIEIQGACSLAPSWYSVSLAKAIIDYYSGLLPSSGAAHPLDWPRPVDWAFVRTDDQSQRRFREASAVFRKLTALEKNHTRKQAVEAWCLACLANVVSGQQSAVAYCDEILKEEPVNVPVLSWASARSLDVSLEVSEQGLLRNVAHGTATTNELLALIAIFVETGRLEEAMRLLDAHAQDSDDAEEIALITYWRAQTLVMQGRCAEATAELPETKGPIDFRPVQAMSLEHKAKESQDWQALTEFMQDWYADTSNSVVLYRLCEVYASQQAWQRLASHADELVKAVPTADAVNLAAFGRYKAKDFQGSLTLLDESHTVFPGSKLPNHLRRMRLSCLQELGIYPDAVAEGRTLFGEEPTVDNALALISIYLGVGDLKQCAVTARQLENETALTPEQTIQLAAIVQSEDRELAIRLWTSALNDKLPDDLVGLALTVGYKLGRDKELRGLTERMASLAQQGHGGAKAFSTPELVEFIKTEQEEGEKNELAYQRGQLLLHMLIDRHNLNAATLYHRTLVQNEQAPDPRTQSALLIRYGGKTITQADDGGKPSLPPWKLHLDTGALLLAAHWEVLEVVEEHFAPLWISPDTIQFLLVCRDRLTPHQPALLDVYRQIIDLVAKGDLAIIDPEPSGFNTDDLVVEQLGRTWVSSFETAVANDGYLLDFVPAQGTNPGQSPLALPIQYASVVVNVRAVIEAMGTALALEPESAEEHLARIGTEGKKAPTNARPATGAHILCHANTVEILADANVLVAASRAFTLSIEREEYERLEGALRYHDRVTQDIDWLDQLIRQLSEGLTVGKYKVTVPPASTTNDDDQTPGGQSTRILLSFLSLPTDPDTAVWIDDRAITKYTLAGGNPIVGVNDVMAALHDAAKIESSVYFTFLMRQRSANVRYIPLTAQELVNHLEAAPISDGVLGETPALATLRRYMASALLSSEHMERPPLPTNAPNPHGETAFLISYHREIASAFVEIWNRARDVDTAVTRCEWMLSNLFIDHLALRTVGLFHPAHDQDAYMLAVSLSGLVTQALSVTNEKGRRREYLSWVNDRVLSSRFRATPLLRAGVANCLTDLWSETLKQGLAEKQNAATLKHLYQRLFDDLPEEIRDAIMVDSDFLGEIGIQVLSTVQVGDITLPRSEFFKGVAQAVDDGVAVVTAVAPDCEITLQRVRPMQGGEGGIVFRHPESDVTVSIEQNALGLLATSVSDRLALLRDHTKWFDCATEERESALRAIATVDDAEGRIDKLELWKSGSPTMYYEGLRNRIRNQARVHLSGLMPPSYPRLLKHLRLEGAHNKECLFNEAAGQLADEEGLTEAVVRYSGLPVPMPAKLVAAMAELSQGERRKIIQRLVGHAWSPVSRIHLLRMLRQFRDDTPAYVRLGRRLGRVLLSEEGEQGFAAFRAILRFTADGFDRMGAEECGPQYRLVIMWYHAHRLFLLFSEGGGSLRDVESSFARISLPVSEKIFWREPKLWGDILHAGRVEYLPFVISGLAYAIGGAASDFGTADLWSRLVDRCFITWKGTRLPAIQLLRIGTNSHNGAGSFLWGDRQSQLARLVPEADLDGLSEESLLNLVTNSMQELREGGNPGLWFFVFGVLGDLPPKEAQIDLLRNLILETDYRTVFQADADTGRIAIQTTAFQSIHLRSEDVTEHLEAETLRVAEMLSSVATKDERWRDSVVILLEVACNIAMARSRGIGEIFKEYIRLWSALLDSIPEMADLTRDIGLRFYEELPAPHAQEFALLLTRLRAA